MPKKDSLLSQLTHQLEANLTTAPVHCVFRRGASWLALPAVAVREVLPRPDILTVPGTPQTFAGLCHVRSEFIPVLNLDSIPCEYGRCTDHIMLILDDDDGPWAVLVDEVSTLRVLDISDAPETDIFDENGAVVGWATADDLVIHVLDQFRVRQLAEKELSAIRHESRPLNRAP